MRIYIVTAVYAYNDDRITPSVTEVIGRFRSERRAYEVKFFLDAEIREHEERRDRRSKFWKHFCDYHQSCRNGEGKLREDLQEEYDKISNAFRRASPEPKKQYHIESCDLVELSVDETP